jgi:outer membrane protein assembly factor BamB
MAAVCAVLVLTAAPVLGASTWPMQGHDAQTTNFNASEQTIGLSNVGQLHVVWSAARVSQAVASDTQVFTLVAVPGSPGARDVAVFDARTGRRLHTFSHASLHLTGTKISLTGDTINAVAFAGGRLILGATTEVIALDPATGRQVWRTSGGALTMTVSGHTIYTAKGCQNPCGPLGAYALNVQSGKVQWKRVDGSGGPIKLIAGRLFQPLGQYYPQTLVSDPHTGRLVAQLPLNASWTGSGTSMYADVLPQAASASQEQSRAQPWLGRISPTGKPAWKVRLGNLRQFVPAAPVLAYNTLYVQSNRFHPGILAVNASTGQIKWGADIGMTTSIIAANHLLFALGRTGQIVVLNADSGRVLRTIAVPGAFIYGPSTGLMIAGGTLYELSGNGLAALRP